MGIRPEDLRPPTIIPLRLATNFVYPPPQTQSKDWIYSLPQTNPRQNFVRSSCRGL